MNAKVIATSKEKRNLKAEFDSMQEAIDYYTSKPGYKLIMLNSRGAFIGFWKDEPHYNSRVDYTINIR